MAALGRREVPEQLAEDHPRRLGQPVELGDVGAQRHHAIGDAGRRGVGAHQLDRAGALDRVDRRRAGARGEEREQPRAAAEIDHHVARPHHRGDRPRVGVDPHAVEHHRDLLGRIGVAVQRHGGHRRIAQSWDDGPSSRNQNKNAWSLWLATSWALSPASV